MRFLFQRWTFYRDRTLLNHPIQLDSLVSVVEINGHSMYTALESMRLHSKEVYSVLRLLAYLKLQDRKELGSSEQWGIYWASSRRSLQVRRSKSDQCTFLFQHQPTFQMVNSNLLKFQFSHQSQRRACDPVVCSLLPVHPQRLVYRGSFRLPRRLDQALEQSTNAFRKFLFKSFRIHQLHWSPILRL